MAENVVLASVAKAVSIDEAEVLGDCDMDEPVDDVEWLEDDYEDVTVVAAVVAAAMTSAVNALGNPPESAL